MMGLRSMFVQNSRECTHKTGTTKGDITIHPTFSSTHLYLGIWHTRPGHLGKQQGKDNHHQHHLASEITGCLLTHTHRTNEHQNTEMCAILSNACITYRQKQIKITNKMK